MTRDIQIVDVSARDGLQNEKNAAKLSAADKVAFIRRLAQAGLKRIEAGSFVHPKVASMSNSDAVAALLAAVEQDFPQVVFSYLVPNLKGLERAIQARAKEVSVFLALSEQFSQANINQTVDASFVAIAPVIAAAMQMHMRVRGYVSNVFGYDDLPFSPDGVAARCRQLLDMGCFELSLGDTTGMAAPDQLVPLVTALQEASVPLSCVAMHFHDTFGRAMANVEASYALGIRIFDAATGGLGGCPYANSPKGNLPMEELVRWCQLHSLSCDVSDVEHLRNAATFIREKLAVS